MQHQHVIKCCKMLGQNRIKGNRAKLVAEGEAVSEGENVYEYQ